MNDTNTVRLPQKPIRLWLKETFYQPSFFFPETPDQGTPMADRHPSPSGLEHPREEDGMRPPFLMDAGCLFPTLHAHSVSVIVAHVKHT